MESGNVGEAASWVKLADLIPWVENPRKNEPAVKKVKESIKRFGFGAPLLVRKANNQIIAGHTRCLAAKALGLTEVPVRFMDLSAEDAKLLALADNKLGEIAEWDEDRLAMILQELKSGDVDVLASGFEQSEIDRLLAELDAGKLEGIEEDPIPEPPADPDSVAGAVYELGPHRLLCGDSTSTELLEKVLGKDRADLLFTDPPYGVDYQSHMAEGGSAIRFRKIENDNLSPERLTEFLGKAFGTAAAALRAGAAIYVCHANQKAGLYTAFETALLSNGFHIAGCIVWVKPSGTMGWQDYRNQYEPILYGWRVGAERSKVEDRTQTNVWEIGRDAAAAYEHPTQKPVELSLRALRNSSVVGETVLDLFGGSGSTLIAAAKSGRKALLVEKDRGYCDVIRQRWDRFMRKVSP